MKIGLVTTDAEVFKKFFPTVDEPDLIPLEPMITPDDQILVNELRKHGFVVNPVLWGTPASALQDYDLLIMRSPWDYMENAKNVFSFSKWMHSLEQAGLLVANPVRLMNWLLDKHYLHHLSMEGINTIPTVYYEQGSSVNLSDIFTTQGPFVIKPCVSAGGVGLLHITSLADAVKYQSQIDNGLKEGDYMVQEVIEEIVVRGEWSLIFFGGKYSHAVHKMPAAGSILVHAESGGKLSFSTIPDKEIIVFGLDSYKKIVPAFRRATRRECDETLLLYLRLDIIVADSGLLLIECEGVEPELYFRAQRDSETKFREAVVSILQSRERVSL